MVGLMVRIWYGLDGIFFSDPWQIPTCWLQTACNLFFSICCIELYEMYIKFRQIYTTNKEYTHNLTGYIDINCSEGSQWYSSNILSSHSQNEIPGGLVVQGLCHQNGRRTILAVGGQVKANGHVSLWDHPIFQIIGYPWIPKSGGGFNGLCGYKGRRQKTLFLIVKLNHDKLNSSERHQELLNIK